MRFTTVALVVPLRLKGGASAVYRQLPVEDRREAAKIKAALRRAFAADKFAAYQFAPTTCWGIR